jgi:hypothetical protein
MPRKVNMTNSNPLRGTLTFNAQDKEGRPEVEKIKSVKFTPANSTGAFRTLGPNDPYEERRAALNAIIRFVFRMDHVEGPFHRYDNANPSRIGGAVGWMNLNGLGAPEDGSTPITVPFTHDYKLTSVTLPHRVVNVTPEELDLLNQGKAIDLDNRPAKGEKVSVVFLADPWVSVREYGEGRLEFRNAPVDQKTGKNLGGLLHSYIAELEQGIQITVAVTTYNWTNPANGEKVLLDSLQGKAQWLQRTVEVEGFDWAAAKQNLIDSNILWRSTQGLLDKLGYGDDEAGSDQETQDALKTLDNRVNGTGPVDIGVNVIDSGKVSKVDATAVLPGVYAVVFVVGGKEGGVAQPPVTISRINGAVILRRLSRRNDLALKNISTF